MSIMNAKHFFTKVEAEEKFREKLENAAGYKERYNLLRQVQLDFHESEIDEAYRNLLTKCQFEYQALVLNDIYIWWKILNE